MCSGPELRKCNDNSTRSVTARCTYNAMKCNCFRKYFEHAGAMLTANGTDDHLIKLEGMTKKDTFSF